MSGTPAERVDCLIVAYESAETIQEVTRQMLTHPKIARVVVVDHGHDGSAELADQAGATAIRVPSNPGFGAGMNRAARDSTAPFLLLMNPDALILDGAIEAGLAALDSRPNAGAAQGSIRTESTGRLERAGGRELRGIDLLGRAISASALLRHAWVARVVRRIPGLVHQVDRSVDQVSEVETLAATALLMRRDAFSSVNGFDERYFLYGEDLDLCRRLRLEGWALLYLPDPWSMHENGSSSTNWWSRELRWWEGTLRFAAQWWSDTEFRFAMVASSLMFGRLAVRSPRQVRKCWRLLLTEPTRLRRSAANIGGVLDRADEDEGCADGGGGESVPAEDGEWSGL